MSKTKTLPPGIPIADAQGKITALSVADLAKQIGQQIGVQSVAWPPSSRTNGWYRIAKIDSGYISAIFMLGHGWYSVTPAGLTFSLNACASGSDIDSSSLVQISGNKSTFDKIRYVRENIAANKGCGYIDIHVVPTGTLDFKATVYSNGGVTLMSQGEVAPSVEGMTVKELTIKSMSGGGSKHLPLRKLQTFCRQERRAAA